MKLTMIAVLGCVLMLLNAHPAAAGDSFDTGSLRGRYTGHLDLDADSSDGTTTYHVDVQLLSALTFDGKGAVQGASRVTVTLPGGDAPLSCAFTTMGSYEIGADGLGSGTFVLAAKPGESCGGGDGGDVTLLVNLAVGGHNRRRLDIAVKSAIDGQGQPLPMVGTGTLEK